MGEERHCPGEDTACPCLWVVCARKTVGGWRSCHLTDVCPAVCPCHFKIKCPTQLWGLQGHRCPCSPDSCCSPPDSTALLYFLSIWGPRNHAPGWLPEVWGNNSHLSQFDLETAQRGRHLSHTANEESEAEKGEEAQPGSWAGAGQLHGRALRTLEPAPHPTASDCLEPRHYCGLCKCLTGLSQAEQGTHNHT